jgi:membrane associated rhomboid family serine protease
VVTLPRTTAGVFLVTSFFTAVGWVHAPFVRAVERSPAALANGEWWRLISPILVNSHGWMQVTLNLVALAIVGVVAERLWGSGLWIVFYIVGGVAGEVAGLAWKPIGAGTSVAVCGLLGSVAVSLLASRGTLPGRVGAFSILAAGLLLTYFHDLHGPPILVTAILAAVILASRGTVEATRT